MWTKNTYKNNNNNKKKTEYLTESRPIKFGFKIMCAYGCTVREQGGCDVRRLPWATRGRLNNIGLPIYILYTYILLLYDTIFTTVYRFLFFEKKKKN